MREDRVIDWEKEAKLWEQRYNEQTEIAALLAKQRDSYAAKMSERMTVHEWLNAKGHPDTETSGKPMCLLRRLAVALGIQPHAPDDDTSNSSLTEPE